MDHGIVAVIGHIPQPAEAQKQMKDEPKHDHREIVSTRGVAQESKTATQALLEL
jgi:hypothetical protein